MKDDIYIRELDKGEYGSALDLVWKVFLEYEAPDYSEQGTEEFRKSINDAGYLAILRCYGAFIGGELIGVIATRNNGDHVALFFVDGKYHRRGIGRKLFEAAVNDNISGEMTVNSSPYAVPVYHRLGFRDTEKEQITNGIRYTPMKVTLNFKES